MDTQKVGIVAMATLALLVFWGGTQLARHSNSSPLETESFINYVIPKLKQFIPKFSLWNRKFIEMNKLAPKAPGSTAKNLAKAQPSATPTPTPAPKAKAKVQVTAPPTPATSDTNNSVAQVPLSTEDPEMKTEPTDSEPISGGGYARNILPAESPTPESQIGEWKMKIYQNPSKQTMNELITEYQSGKINKTVFYQILDDLMRDSSPEFQNLAIYALAGTPSFDSLALLLTSKEHLAPETTPMLRIALDGYAKTDRMRILELALRSNNPTVIMGSLPMILQIGSKMTLWTADYSSQAEGSGRDRRGPTNRVPKSDFGQILEALNQLEDSSDRILSQAARDTLSQLSFHPNSRSRE